MSREALRDYLVSTDIFGDRVYSYVAPRKAARPYCVIEFDGIEPTEHMTGVDSLKKERYSMHIVADTASNIDEIASSLIAAMESFSNKRAYLSSASESYQFDDGKDLPSLEKIISYGIFFDG
jgi:hypothetical protein